MIQHYVVIGGGASGTEPLTKPVLHATAVRHLRRTSGSHIRPARASDYPPHTAVEVTEARRCDLCGYDAEYDAKTTDGPWGNLCGRHFEALGIGLGLGLGQRLVLVQS